MKLIFLEGRRAHFIERDLTELVRCCSRGVINKLIELGLEDCANEVINYSICSVEFSIILFGIAKLQNNWKFETSNFKYSHQI
ncbi:hypothetical protein ABKV19_008091 [Rosa sericea]